MTHYGFSALAFGSLLCHYIDFAVKGIAKIIGDFGDVTIKQQITEFAEGTARVGQAHPELANVLAFVLRSSIDRRDQLSTERSYSGGRSGRSGPLAIHLSRDSRSRPTAQEV